MKYYCESAETVGADGVARSAATRGPPGGRRRLDPAGPAQRSGGISAVIDPSTSTVRESPSRSAPAPSRAMQSSRVRTPPEAFTRARRSDRSAHRRHRLGARAAGRMEAGRGLDVVGAPVDGSLTDAAQHRRRPQRRLHDRLEHGVGHGLADHGQLVRDVCEVAVGDGTEGHHDVDLARAVCDDRGGLVGLGSSEVRAVGEPDHRTHGDAPAEHLDRMGDLVGLDAQGRTSPLGGDGRCLVDLGSGRLGCEHAVVDAAGELGRRRRKLNLVRLVVGHVVNLAASELDSTRARPAARTCPSDGDRRCLRRGGCVPGGKGRHGRLGASIWMRCEPSRSLAWSRTTWSGRTG